MATKKKKNDSAVPILLLGLFGATLLINPKGSGSNYDPGPGGGGSGGGGTIPRGVRNNNIGNIKLDDANPWLGKIPRNQNTDGTFEQFTEKKYGTRAMLKLIKRYYDEFGLMSIYDIINRYSKSSMQPDHDYVPFLSNKMGVISTGYIDRNRLIELAYYMAWFENKKPPTTISELRAVNAEFNIGL